MAWDHCEIELMGADDAQFEARVMTLINDVRHHVNEEEGEILGKLRLALGELTLRALGEELQAAKQARMSGHDPSVLRELPFPGPEILEEASTANRLHLGVIRTEDKRPGAVAVCWVGFGFGVGGLQERRIRPVL
jgi:hypothetical protein